ncbi:BICD family-like cargo adapter 2 [Protopterus annectens]|uniref:BICD family-like cargo adapter 2 n=1 Tax=Protopterus annectens TaxID=7888 RepID=UPI001CFA9B0D|nr:BICD family-like cargo adapter 2 [Protopterus annectens]
MEESATRQSTIEMLQESIALLKRHQYEKELQLSQVKKELQEARTSNHEAQQKLRNMNDVIRLQEVKPSSTSLLSEIRQTVEGGSALATQMADHTVPSHLQMESLTNHGHPQGNPEGHVQVPEEHTEHLQSMESDRESVKTISSLTAKERDVLKEKEDQIFKLQDEVALQQVEIKNWKEEVENLQNLLQESDMEESLKQAITDRNEAVMKKNQMELEVTKSLQERESMKRQLLDTIQKKVELSQELEEWQEDMQIVISQQLKTQHKQEQETAEESSLRRSNSTHRRSFRSKQHNSVNSDAKGFFSSLFRKSS